MSNPTLSPLQNKPEVDQQSIYELSQQEQLKDFADERQGYTDEESREAPQQFVTNNRDVIHALHKVLEEDMVFLRPDVHIDDVARILLSNRTYVTRLMRQEYGLSFIEYVNIARIQYSQNLLYSTRMSVDEVSEKSGFQSTSNYCRAFKRYIGISPLQWRKTLPEQLR